MTSRGIKVKEGNKGVEKQACVNEKDQRSEETFSRCSICTLMIFILIMDNDCLWDSIVRRFRNIMQPLIWGQHNDQRWDLIFHRTRKNVLIINRQGNKQMESTWTHRRRPVGVVDRRKYTLNALQVALNKSESLKSQWSKKWQCLFFH